MKQHVCVAPTLTASAFNTLFCTLPLVATGIELDIVSEVFFLDYTKELICKRPFGDKNRWLVMLADKKDAVLKAQANVGLFDDVDIII